MADHDSDTPQGTPRPTPDPHRGEPTPAPDAHTRPEARGEVRPDQQEELGPIEGLMEASAAEVSAEVTGDPDAQAEAERLGAEGEGVEAAQIFSIMLATAITLGLAVFGVFFLVAEVADEKTVERDAVVLYPELREVQRVAAEMENYSRTDSLYRLPIGAAMSQVSEAYYAQQEGSDGVVPAPDNFSTLYLDAIRESEVGVREYELDALGYDSLIQREQTIPQPGVDLGPGTEAEGSDVEAETDVPPTEEPEDR
ncbi:MAG: hypothetical protein ABJF88_00485 [Rhodothermales bacterium]